MRCVIISGIFPPDIGGPASYVPIIAEELVNKGHTVCVVCLSDSIQEDDSWRRYSVFRIKRNIFKPLRIICTIWQIIRQLFYADCVFINGLSFESMIAARLTNTPSVHKIVGDYAWERARNYRWFLESIDKYQVASKGILLNILDWIRYYPLKSADKIIVPSNYLKNIVTGWSIDSKKINVIYNSVMLPLMQKEEIKVLEPFEGKTIITICRLTIWKGVKELISTVATLQNVRLIIVGDGPEREVLKKHAEDLFLSERIVFVGQVSKKMVCEYLKYADCFVLNSTYEGLPHVILEAMIARIPVVATNVGGTNEVVENNETGLLIDAEDENQLRNGIKKVLENESFRKYIINNAWGQMKEKFSYCIMIEQTVKVLSEVVKKRR